jgi:hypothetical protein
MSWLHLNNVVNGMRVGQSVHTNQLRECGPIPKARTALNLGRFDNLIMRFEEPSSMVRWDSPLFTIPTDEEPPYDVIWKAITTGEMKPPTAAVTTVRSTIIPPAPQLSH